MSRRSTERLDPVPSPPLPADHVLNSGAVLFPGAFDQHGCPLVVFPADGLDKLATELNKAEVVDFINYFLILHNKKQDRDSLVSVVADLRQAPLSAARIIAETLLLLQTASTVHTAYLVLPIKKDVLKTLQKSIAPSKPHNTAFKKVLLKDVAELSNYIDRSQLPPCLGGYFMYHHPSWVAFIKEIDLFLQEFLSVVQRLPTCISTLQSISRLPIPEDLHLLTDFCSANQNLFLRLRRELGLDELQDHCEQMGSKLRFPEQDPCYLAMAGTPLFTDTARDMLHHYSRITSAVAKIELLWQQAFYKAHVQLRLLQLHKEALRIRDQMEALLTERVQPYRVEVAEDEERARATAAEFVASVYTPAMALVRCSEDVLHTLEETVPGGGGPGREPWVGELEALKDQLLSAVEPLHQTIGAQCDFHRCLSKANRWYGLVLRENFLQGLLLGLKEESPSCVSGQRQGRSGQGPGPDPRRKALAAFLRGNPPPALQELLVLAQLAHTLPQPRLQRAGRQVAQRCMTLRKLLISQDTLAFSDLQIAIQWQYDLLSSSHVSPPHALPPEAAKPDGTAEQTERNPSLSPRSRSNPVREIRSPAVSRSHCRCSPTSPGPWRIGKDSGHQQQVLLAMPPQTEGKPSSLSSFDSGFDGAGCSPLEAAAGGGGGGREAWQGLSGGTGSRESFRPSGAPPRTHAENSSGALDAEDLKEAFDFGSVGNSSRASVQVVPKIKLDSLNFQIKVQRSATPPQNPWLSLPVDDLENSYTVTITQNPPGQQKAPDLSRNHSSGSRDQPTQTEVPASPLSDAGPPAADGILPSLGGNRDPGLSPIRHLLSSTITDGMEKSECTAEGNPTLIWDSYDLHDQNHAHERPSGSVEDVSMIDWDVTVQQDLRNVEEILERADGILAEEEDVLSQEAMFEDLVRSETHHWELWENEEQLGPMCASELAEAGVLGLDEDLDYPDCQTRDWCPTPTPSSGFESLLDSCYRVEDRTPSGFDLPGDRVDLLPELRNIHILDELILEENLEIHKLRRQVETLEEERRGAHRGEQHPSAGSGSVGQREERQAFRHKLQKETMEVERMETSLKQELASGSSRTRKVVKCSALVTFGTLDPDDQELCDDLLSGSRRRSHRALQQNLEEPLRDTPGQECHEDSDEQHDEESLNCDLDPLAADVDETSEPLPTLNLTTIRNFQYDLEGLPPEEGLEPQSAMAEMETDMEPGGSDLTCKPEASLIPEMGPEDGAFDPGGEPTLPPGPKPRAISLEATAVSMEIQERPCSVEPTSEPSPTPTTPLCDPPLCDPPLCDPPPCDPPPCDPPPCDPPPCDPPTEAPPKPKERKHRPLSGGDGLLGSAVSGHSSNNNHNNNNPLSEESPASFMEDALDTDNAAMAPACNGTSQNHSQYPLGSQTPMGLCSSVPPSPPLETPGELTACDPCGRSDDCEDVADGFQRSASTRISRTFLPAHQPTVKQEDYSEISDFKTPIVLDTGSGVMKAGFADEELPAIIFPTVIGLPKYEEMMNGSSEREGFIGHDAQHMRGVLALRYPMKNGVIHNWDDMEKIWHHAFQQLCADPEDHPVMLTEAPMSPLHNRQRAVEVMFERFCVPYVYVAMQAVLALYAAGRCTGVVLDSGDGASHSVPVYEGYSLPHAVQRFPLAGLDVTLHLTKLLQEQGVCMRTSAELEIVREMKERCCRVALDYEVELAPGGPSAGREMSYTLPDGQVVCLDTERFRAPEILFRPELIGRDHYGMHESLYKSVLSTDVDLRRELLGNIVLSGGNTLLAGLPERLQRELGRLEPGGPGGRVRVSSPADRGSSVWRGGAALASMPAPGGCAWISREEYEEHGPQIVFRKCF
ncbi:uncharacterized protein LOC130374150 isoform X1 [Gadus chalcogrammus]|uniref:uncharacterized protein LOC130374150 isoform X1 n=1 Tax=Gadus chalcogrammus TaxID=1042646 RepID=UPI0024C4B58B|nr:uncharacterized protein LOC130374150 isoform X1 [Gadus chalcogrammus]